MLETLIEDEQKKVGPGARVSAASLVLKLVLAEAEKRGLIPKPERVRKKG